MALIDTYNQARDTNFRARILAALWSQSLTFLGTAPDPTVAADLRGIRLARAALATGNDAFQHVVSALAAAGLTSASSDGDLSAAIGTNWAKLAFMWDSAV